MEDLSPIDTEKDTETMPVIDDGPEEEELESDSEISYNEEDEK